MITRCYRFGFSLHFGNWEFEKAKNRAGYDGFDGCSSVWDALDLRDQRESAAMALANVVYHIYFLVAIETAQIVL